MSSDWFQGNSLTSLWRQTSEVLVPSCAAEGENRMAPQGQSDFEFAPADAAAGSPTSPGSPAGSRSQSRKGTAQFAGASSRMNTRKPSATKTLAAVAAALALEPGTEELSDEEGVLLRKKSFTRTVNRSRFFIEHGDSANLSDAFEVEERPIGRGGFGCVRRARARGSGTERAIKTVYRRDLREEGMVRREVDILRQLDHPSVCRLFSTFTEGNKMHLVMEMVKGKDLYDYIQDVLMTEGANAIDEPFAFRVIGQIFGALNYCHERGVVHRDIKPENIMVGEYERIKLIDFGLAAVKRRKPSKSSPLQHRPSPSFQGTFAYAAPEVQEREVPAEPSMDIWSAGMVLHTLLVGELPEPEVREGTAPIDRSLETYRDTSAQAMDFLLDLVVADPDRRIRAGEALARCRKMGGGQGPGAMMARFRRKSRGGTADAAAGGAEVSAGVWAKRCKKAFLEFHQSKSLRRAVLTAIAMQSADQAAQELQARFLQVDRDGNGCLSKQELADCFIGQLSEGTCTEACDWIETVFSSVDTDGSEEIEYSEFLAATLEEGARRSEQAMRDAFNTFDLDGSGKISLAEFARIMNEPEETIQKLLPEFDRDRDGEIDFDEFKAIVDAQQGTNMADARRAQRPPGCFGVKEGASCLPPLPWKQQRRTW
eukprot:TRINITY_DN4172_c0_g2_i1.p1 TRINITY_DN4172_c0_g2~~TRINITY_DN4172_c0_g2_i1.p1  ORF type:complete len:654 (+),score=140.86 TRINITY_DN4172_c0_g2_i1:57-2018(+)